MDTTKKTVNEIREYLEKNYNVDVSVLNTLKGKSNLVNLLKTLEETDAPNIDIINNMTIDNNEKLNPLKEEEVTSVHPKWSEYVLNHLLDDEKDQGYPKSDGLRRLVEYFIAPIKQIDSIVIQTPREDNNWTSTVRTTIFLTNNTQYSACADAVKQYCPKPYDQHLTAIAETRAEGRAYRKILRLKNTATREEMSGDSPIDSNELINENQKVLIDIMCARLDINVKKLFDSYFLDNKQDNILKYTHAQAAEIGAVLSKYQADTNSIPTNLLGYDASWKF